jgi:hypothetical protein
MVSSHWSLAPSRQFVYFAAFTASLEMFRVPKALCQEIRAHFRIFDLISRRRLFDPADFVAGS